MSVTAEGVEMREQLESLKTLGVNFASLKPSPRRSARISTRPDRTPRGLDFVLQIRANRVWW
jgi:hypothetical protein